MPTVYVAFDGDSIGARIGRAVLADDVGEVARVSQSIDSGEDLWRSFALRSGGQMISWGGDEGSFSLNADHLAELPDIARQYVEQVGATVSVGVGLKLSEASKALMFVKLTGKNRIALYEPSMEATLDAATANPKTEEQKIGAEYLHKADAAQPGVTGTVDKDQHTGFKGVSTGSKTKGTQGDHEEGAQAEKLIEDAQEAAQEAAPPPPETTHAAEDFEAQLHDMASQQSQKDDSDNQQKTDRVDQVKRKVAEVLIQVRQQMPVLQQLQTSAPDTFAAIMGLVQGVIELGRNVSSGKAPPPDHEPSHVQAALSTVQKNEDLTKAVSSLPPGKQVSDVITPVSANPNYSAFSTKYDYSHLLPLKVRDLGYTMTVHHHGVQHTPEHRIINERIDAHVSHPLNKRSGMVKGVVRTAGGEAIEPHSDLHQGLRGQGVGSAMYEAVYAHAKNVVGIDRVRGGIHSRDADALHQRLAQKHGFNYTSYLEDDNPAEPYPYGKYAYTIKDELAPDIHEDRYIGPGRGVVFERSGVKKDEMDSSPATKEGELDKANLGANVAATGRHLHLPVGSVLDGKIKVQHGPGGPVGWKEVRAGMVAGKEPDSPLFGQNSHPVSSREPGAK